MDGRNEKCPKWDRAWNIVVECLAPGFGVYASPDRYLYQCWTRDLALAVAPLLLSYGHADIVKDHLRNLCERQRDNGQIHILFLSDEKEWRARKVAQRGENSFMVGRYDAGELWNLTPGTKDPEILFVIAMYEYRNATGDNSLFEEFPTAIESAIGYVEHYNMTDDKLVVGADWRDTMEKELANKPLLTNNVLLARAYQLMGQIEHAEDLERQIMMQFVQEGLFVDYLPDGVRPDPLGLALGVLNNVVPEAAYQTVVRQFGDVDTNCGVTIKCIHNPYSSGEQEVFAQTGGEVVWPFVVGFTAMALKKMGYIEYANEMLQKMEQLNGFYEWYDPRNGKGYGAKEQLWSAALYIRASDYVRGIG